MPFVPGHEVVADLLDDCEDLPAGTRVVIDPVLTCAARGVEPCDGCASGATNRCSRITVGHLSPGLQTGFCTDTGGGWGEVLTRPPQPAARRARGLLRRAGGADRADWPARCTPRCARASADNDRVLVSGAGSVGLLTTLALRSLTDAGEITVVAKHAHQRELALQLGATEVVAPERGAAPAAPRRPVRSRSSPSYSSPYLLGGVDVAVDAVGSKQSLETALHATRAGGRVVLSGMPAAGRPVGGVVPRARGGRLVRLRPREPALGGRSAFDIAMELLAGDAVSQLAKTVGELPAAPLARGTRPRARRRPARHGQGCVRSEE